MRYLLTFFILLAACEVEEVGVVDAGTAADATVGILINEGNLLITVNMYEWYISSDPHAENTLPIRCDDLMEAYPEAKIFPRGRGEYIQGPEGEFRRVVDLECETASCTDSARLLYHGNPNDVEEIWVFLDGRGGTGSHMLEVRGEEVVAEIIVVGPDNWPK